MNKQLQTISKKSKFSFLTIGLIVFFILFIIIIENYFSFLQKGLSLIQNNYNQAASSTINIFSNINYLENIISENNNIKIDNVKLIQENIALKNLESENQQLRKLLNYTEENQDTKFTTASIYASSTLNISDIISLDQGQNNNIKIDDPVIFNNIYLGKIIEVSPNISKAQLITSPQHSIVGQISEINTTGIIKGQIGYGLVMEDIPPDAKLAIGQIVTTSYFDPQIPANLLIGKISEIKHNDQDIFQTAYLEPLFDIKDIRFVLIRNNE